MTELNEKGQLGGFCGLPNDAPSSAFDVAIKAPAVHKTADVIAAMIRWIRDACRRKQPGTYADTLLIEGTMLHLSTDRWKEKQSQLSTAVQSS